MSAPHLVVGPDQRTLVTTDGSERFLLADTAWDLFQALDLNEADHYLATRAAQGFLGWQGVLLSERDGTRVPNACGDLPLFERDPARPNPAFFAHADAILDLADGHGLATGVVLAWGDKWFPRWPGSEGEEIFTAHNAEWYARWIGTRWRGRPVWWILGGDRPPLTATHRAVIDAFAQGLVAAGCTQPITFHAPVGHGSWEWFADRPWCAFHQWQSSHHHHGPPAEMYATAGWAAVSAPLMDGEPPYEGHPRMLGRWSGHRDFFDSTDVRIAAWRSVLAGSAGHVYGAHDVWSLHEPGRRPAINHMQKSWREALLLAGAPQMGVLRSVMESLPLTGRRPGQQLLRSRDSSLGGQRELSGQLCLRGADDRWLLVGTPFGEAISMELPPGAWTATWIDPRSGARSPAQAEAQGLPTWWPPSDDDWVLLLMPCVSWPGQGPLHQFDLGQAPIVRGAGLDPCQ